MLILQVVIGSSGCAMAESLGLKPPARWYVEESQVHTKCECPVGPAGLVFQDSVSILKEGLIYPNTVSK